MRLCIFITREVKSWPVKSTCKIRPMLRIRFFIIIPRPKIPHSRFGAESESGTFGQGMVKNYFLTRTCDVLMEEWEFFGKLFF